VTEAVKTGEPIEPPAPGDEIRTFGHAGIQSAIDSALAALPEGRTVAVVAHVDHTGRARASVMARVTGGWSFVGVLQHAPSRGFHGEAAVMWAR
jgi:hypothetical protein